MQKFRSIGFKHFLVSLAGMLLLSAYIFGVFYFIHHAKGESSRINLAGSLRFHSYRIAWLIKLIEDVEARDLQEPLTAELNHEIDIFDTIISGLKDGSPQLGFKPISHYENQTDLFNRINGRWHTYLRPAIKKLVTVFEASGHLNDKDYQMELKGFHEKFNFLINAYVNEIDEFTSYAVIHYEDEIENFELISFYFLGAIFIMAILLFLFVKRAFVRPIVGMNNTVLEFEKGNYDARIEIKNRDELGSLAERFNGMAAAIRRLFDENRSLIDYLDYSVKERTHELEKSNLELERFGSRLYKLYEVSFAAKENTQEFTTMILNEMAELFDVNSVLVGVVHDAGWAVYAVSGKNDLGLETGAKLPPGMACCMTQKDQQPMIIENIALQEKCKEGASCLNGYGVSSCLGVPIFVSNIFWGTLCSLSEKPGYFTEQDLILHQILSKRLEFEFAKEKYQDELRTALLYAEAANNAKSDFLANMSHELRTPLNAIIGFSDTMLTGFAGELSEKQKEYLSYILEGGRHLLEIINAILDLSKIESGSMGLEKTAFRIKDLIVGSISMFREKVSSHNMKTEVVIEEGIEYIEADRVKIKQILVNLLSNAFKFTPDGGSVRISARRVGSSELGVGSEGKESSELVSGNKEKIYSQLPTPYSQLNGDFIEISVADTGIGISQEDQAKLFKPFQQLELALTKKYAGAGLGLSLCMKLVELHGGSIWVESEKDKGSRFVFVIPTLFSD